MANLKLKPGVITGKALDELFAYCKEVDCALPAVNVIGSSSANAALAAAKEAKAPIIIQFSHGGVAVLRRQVPGQRPAAGVDRGRRSRARCTCARWPRPTACRSSCTPTTARRSCCPGSTACSTPARSTSRATASRCSARTCSTCPRSRWTRTSRSAASYLSAWPSIEMTLEIELGVTGGEEDGVDNSGVDNSKLYTQPEDVLAAYDALQPGRQLHGRGLVRQHARRVRARQRQAHAADPEELAGRTSQKQRKTGREAGRLRVPRRLGLDRGGDPRGGLLRRREDEHRHRHAVGVHAADQEVHGREGRLPAGAARQPRGRRQAEQEATSTRAAGCTSARRA